MQWHASLLFAIAKTLTCSTSSPLIPTSDCATFSWRSSRQNISPDDNNEPSKQNRDSSTPEISPAKFRDSTPLNRTAITQHWHPPETPGIESETPRAARGEKFETCQARGALLDDGCWLVRQQPFFVPRPSPFLRACQRVGQRARTRPRLHRRGRCQTAKSLAKLQYLLLAPSATGADPAPGHTLCAPVYILLASGYANRRSCT